MKHLTFNEWLEKHDQEFYSEVNWKKLGRTAALAGGLGLAALGGANSMLGPSDMDLVQKHFPNIAVQSLDKSNLKNMADAARAMEKSGTTNDYSQDIDQMDKDISGLNKSFYKHHLGKKPEGGFRGDVPATHYQNPEFWYKGNPNGQ